MADCNDPACTGGDETITTVDSGGDVGWYSSIVLGGDGKPTISYYDWTNGDLKVARRLGRPVSPGALATVAQQRHTLAGGVLDRLDPFHHQTRRPGEIVQFLLPQVERRPIPE